MAISGSGAVMVGSTGGSDVIRRCCLPCAAFIRLVITAA